MAALAGVNILWISGQGQDGESALIAGPIAQLLSGFGHRLTYWPLGPERPYHPAGFGERFDGPSGQGWSGPVQVMGAIRRHATRYDLVVVEQDLAWDFRTLEAVLGLARRPPVWLLATLPLSYYLASRGEHHVARTRRLAEKLLGRFDRILTLAAAVARDLVQHFGVPEARATTVLWPAPAAPAASPQFGSEVAVAGSITGIKGVDVLVDVLARLRQEGLAATLRVFGDGPERPEMEAEAEREGVPLQREPLTPALTERLATSSVFCGPQWLDGTAWDYVTAAAAGLPLTGVSAPEAPAEILLGGTLGRLAGLGETDRLADSLRGLLTDRRIWAGYHEASRLLANRHRAPAMTSGWEAILPPSS